MTKTIECGCCDGTGEVTLHDSHRGRTYTYNRECMVCRGDGVKTVEVDDDPDPDPATITVGGFTITAPGFTAASFDRAIMRAHNDGLTVAPTDRHDMVLVVNPASGASYTVSRSTCTCRAGQQGMGCKHRAMAIALADAYHDLPTAPVAA